MSKRKSYTLIAELSYISPKIIIVESFLLNQNQKCLYCQVREEGSHYLVIWCKHKNKLHIVLCFWTWVHTCYLTANTLLTCTDKFKFVCLFLFFFFKSCMEMLHALLQNRPPISFLPPTPLPQNQNDNRTLKGE